MTDMLIVIFGLLIAAYGCVLGRDIFAHRAELREEKGSPALIALATAGIQFLATFGMSDFSLSIPLYRGAKWVDDRRLPGTLFNAAVIPGALISILYISGADVQPATLLCCIISQSLGCMAGANMVSRMNGNTVRTAMGVALLFSAAVIVVRSFLPGAEGGELTGFPVTTLIWLCPVYFGLGVLNAMGFGVKSISMALLMTLGLSPLSVLPIVLASCGVCCCCGAVQFLRKGMYQRRIALISTFAGSAAVLAGAGLVKSISTSTLQWIMVGVMCYTAYTMLKKPRQAPLSAGSD